MRILHFYRKTTPRATSFGPFIVFRDSEVAASERTNTHEMIHFLQQIELLFVFQWILYAGFYLFHRFDKPDHYTAYRANPFEMEAFEHDDDIKYLIKRKPYAWIKYL